MKYIAKHKNHIIAAVLIFGLLGFGSGFTLLASPAAYALDSTGADAKTHGLPTGTACPSGQEPLKGNNFSCCPKGYSNNATQCLFAKYINPIINLLSILVGLLIVVGLVVGGIQIETSAGDPQKAAAGRSLIGKVLVGLLVYLLLYAFLQFIVPGGIIADMRNQP